MQLLWLYKVDLQCGQAHVCSHYTANGITCPPVQHIMWPKWLDINASCMCLDEFTPEFTAVCLWSGYQRRIFHAKVCAIDDVIVLVSLCRVLGCCAISTAIHGRVPQGGKWGIRQGAPVGGEGGKGWCQRGTPQLLKMTPDDLTHNQTLHITMSQQATRSAVRRRENGLRGQKVSLIILYGNILCISPSLSHTRMHTLLNPHTLSQKSTTHEPI